MSPERLRYEIRTYKLDNARSDEEWSVTGGLVHAIKATSRGAEIKVRINAIQNPQITIAKGDSIETRVTKLYISNTAQAAESVDLLVVPNPEVLKVLQGAEIGDIDTIGTLGSITQDVKVKSAASPNDELQVKTKAGTAIEITGGASPLGVSIKEGSAAWDQVSVVRGELNNPAANDVIVTTGDLPAGLYESTFMMTTNVDTDALEIHRLTAADAITLSARVFTQGNIFHIVVVYFKLLVNEELRVVSGVAVTGKVNALIATRRLLP